MHRIITLSAVIAATGLVLGFLWPFIAGADRPDSRVLVRELARTTDPLSMDLQPGFASYMRTAHLPDGTECGVFSTTDHSHIQYWFASHHLTRDLGSTLFRFADGSERVMAGYFCCELQLPEAGFRDEKAVHAFIDHNDGKMP
jgi:hypothetical protein